ncbi:MAG: toll/interleukin-1 receptor domain-containing protein [Phycisphaerales bacterium]
MATAWLTYAWADNESGDVDFVAQELRGAGLRVDMDRFELPAGIRLWERIAEAITIPSHSDAWLWYATQASLGSEPCKEEFAYALDRALNARGEEFPIIAVFPGPMDRELIPAAIRVRRHVSLTDTDWRERIVAAAERRPLNIGRNEVPPYELRVHCTPYPARPLAVEFRPRAGSWAPCMVAIPLCERRNVEPVLVRGPRGRPPGMCLMGPGGEGLSEDQKWWNMHTQDEATPTQSLFLMCAMMPSQVAFGCISRGGPLYREDLTNDPRWNSSVTQPKALSADEQARAVERRDWQFIQRPHGSTASCPSCGDTRDLRTAPPNPLIPHGNAYRCQRCKKVVAWGTE